VFTKIICKAGQTLTKWLRILLKVHTEKNLRQAKRPHESDGEEAGASAVAHEDESPFADAVEKGSAESFFAYRTGKKLID